MASNVTSLNWGKIATQGAIAGVVGGIVIALFLFLALGAIFHLSPAVVLTMDAHNVKSDNPLVGLLAHLAVSILWGIGYVYAAATRPNIATKPWISGIAFGVVVWVLMQFVLMLGAVWPGLTLQTTAIGLLAHMVFFGIPVALTTRALQKTQ
jgi:uncharacterized membrane protein YagU involved in acid resistance